MGALPSISELDRNFSSIENVEEVLLLHPAIDYKLTKDHLHEIDVEKLQNVYETLAKKGKLKSYSHEFMDMLRRVQEDNKNNAK